MERSADRAAGWRLLAALAVASAVQKLSNNYEGLTKVLVRGTLDRSEQDGGLGLDTAAAGAFLTAAGLGYFIKPLFGAVTDRLPVFGYRRKSWLVLASLALSAAWLGVALGGAASYLPLLIALTVVNVTVTFADVVCDGLMVEAGQRAEREGSAAAGAGNRPLQVAQWSAALGAMIVAAAAGGLVARYATLAQAAWAGVALPLVAVASALVLIREERVAWDWRAARGGFAAVGLAAAVGAAVLGLKFASRGTPFAVAERVVSPVLVLGAVLLVARVPRALLAPAALVILWPSLPFKAESQVMYRYLTTDNTSLVAAIESDAGLPGVVRRGLTAVGLETGSGERFAELFYGSVFLTTELVAGVAGLLLLGRFGKRVALKWVLAGCLVGWAAALAAYSGLLFGGGPGYLLGCALGSGFLTWVGNTAVLFYAATKVPHDDGAAGQATVFAVLMGLSNLGGMYGVETVGAWVYQTGVDRGGPDTGLGTLLGVSAGYLVVLAGVVAWLAQRGELDPPPGNDNEGS